MEQEATVSQVKDYFGMTITDLMRDWKELSIDDKRFFKVEVYKELHKEVVA